MMTHITRALQLLMQAIRELDTFDEFERLRATAWELYASDDETFRELMREIEARTAVLTRRLTQGDVVANDAATGEAE